MRFDADTLRRLLAVRRRDLEDDRIEAHAVPIDWTGVYWRNLAPVDDPRER